MAREPIQQTVERLAHTSGGRILASARDGLRRSLKYYVALLLVGFILAFPLSSEFIKWLIRDSRLPQRSKSSLFHRWNFFSFNFESQVTLASSSFP